MGLALLEESVENKFIFFLQTAWCLASGVKWENLESHDRGRWHRDFDFEWGVGANEWDTRNPKSIRLEGSDMQELVEYALRDAGVRYLHSPRRNWSREDGLEVDLSDEVILEKLDKAIAFLPNAELECRLRDMAKITIELIGKEYKKTPEKPHFGKRNSVAFNVDAETVEFILARVAEAMNFSGLPPSVMSKANSDETCFEPDHKAIACSERIIELLRRERLEYDRFDKDRPLWEGHQMASVCVADDTKRFCTFAKDYFLEAVKGRKADSKGIS